MSTDLHLQHELPKLRIAAVNVDDLPSDDDDNNNDAVSSVVTRAETEDDVATSTTTTTAASVVAAGAESEDQSYRTPTSKESKIPENMTCPPAPRKRKLASCKRKLLDEFQFFDVTNKEDMDAFFKSTFPKRSCPCT